MAVCGALLTVMLLSGVITDSLGDRYATGARRTGHRLSSVADILQQHQVSDVQKCLNQCDRLAGCVALNFGTVSSTVNCELMGRRACDGLPLLADAAVDYYDVYTAPENLTAESHTPYWDDPGCVQDGYCAAECAAEAAGDFCTVDAHCNAKLTPPGGHQCVSGACQTSADFWELRPGVALPRWQTWRIDSHVWSFKKLSLGTCSLDISLKLGPGAVAHIVPVYTEAHVGTRLAFRIYSTYTDIYYHDSAGTGFNLNMGVNTVGMVNGETYSPLKVSWCGGNLAIGPESNPTLATAFASVTQPIDYVMVHSSYTDSWMRVNAGVADKWLFEDAGVAEDAVMQVPSDTYVYRRIAPTRNVTVKYDCMAARDCVVVLRGVSRQMLVICVGCWDDTNFSLSYHGVIQEDTNLFPAGPVLSATEFNTFTVTYNNLAVSVYRNDNKIPVYSAIAPHAMEEIQLIGIGGCCGAKTVRAARYDPAWRTDTWITEGSGYSNGDEAEPVVVA